MALGAVTGVGIVAAARDATAPTRAGHPPSVTRFSFTDGSLPPVTAAMPAGTTIVLAEEPPTSEAALTRFLSALTEGTSDAAYALLDAPSRQRYPTATSWARARADMALPTAFEMGPSRTGFSGGGDVVEIEVTATHEPSLDSVRGLVPARSRSLWQVRSEEGRWRVGAAPSAASPILPSDADVPGTVRAWIGRLQACDRPGSVGLQVGDHLYGPAQLVDGPCERPGAWTVGAPLALDRAADPKDFLAAFGPGVGVWARVVPVEGPGRPFLAVVAPIGEVWRVMGVAVRG